MTPEHACLGMRVRVMEHHRVEERRGLVGTVVARYGGEEYIAVDVRLAGGERRLFWPRDLEEISPSSLQAWWRLLVGWALRVNSGPLFTPKYVEGEFCELRVYRILGSSPVRGAGRRGTRKGREVNPGLRRRLL